ncbi:MAG: hypothetical protein JW996_01055 [Candidatus Cloacimonetes bacterium]|nr:hypothetical protein [Candidatus Cloacimonadota bacterium]
MKKALLFFLIVLLSLSLFITGCGDDDDDDNGNGTGPSTDPEDYEYFFLVMRSGEREAYTVMLMNYDGDPINNVNFAINGQNVDMTYFELGAYWFADVELEVGETYNYELSINRESWDFDLATAAIPVVDWPNSFDPAQGMDVSWILNPNENSMVQEFGGTSWIYDEVNQEYELIDEEYVLLEGDARNYNVPANWMSDGQDEYDFMLAETNYYFTDKFLAVAVELSIALYGDWERDQIDEIAIAKKIASHLR